MPLTPFQAEILRLIAAHRSPESHVATEGISRLLVQLQNNTAPVGRDFGSTIQACDYVVSFDGGATWRRHKLPSQDTRQNPQRLLLFFRS